ncbi:MAG TPA: hypothetical protein VIM61_09710 [Chthoniobacterales bacterium]
MPALPNCGKSVAKRVRTVPEIGNHRLRGCRKFRGRAFEANPAFFQQRDAVARDERLGDVVCHDERGEAELPLIFRDHGEHRIAPQRIEAGGGFVEEDQFGLRDDGPGERETLLHATRHLAGIPVATGVQFELPQSFEAAFTDGIVLEIGRLFKRERDVFQRRERVEKRIALEQKTRAPPKIRTGGRIAGGQFATIEENPTGLRRLDAREAFQENRFPRPARPQHGEHAAATHPKADAGQDGVRAEALVEILDPEQEIVAFGAHRQTMKDVIT